MPRVVRSALEEFAILEGASRGHVARHSVSAIAERAGVSRATVRAKIKQFVEDGRPLSAFLDAHRPPDVIDHKLERRRQFGRERQRAWQQRANGTAPVPTVFKRTGRPRIAVPERVLDLFTCMGAVGRDIDRVRIAMLLQRRAATMTAGVHNSWTTEAVVSQWRQLDAEQQLKLDTYGLTLADVLPPLLSDWGWEEDDGGVWVERRKKTRRASGATSCDSPRGSRR